MANPPTKESTKVLLTESYVTRKTTQQLLVKLADKNIEPLKMAEAKDALLQKLYTANHPVLHKDLKKKIVNILTSNGKLGMFGKENPLLSPDLQKLAATQQEKTVATEEAKDNKLIQEQTSKPRRPGQGS